jgi:hypothetical protein
MVVGAKFGAANGGTGLRQNDMIKGNCPGLVIAV